MEQVKLPKPTRGIIAQIAKETGISVTAVLKRYHKADPVTVLKVATLEQDLLQQRINAINQFARAIAVSSTQTSSEILNVVKAMQSEPHE